MDVVSTAFHLFLAFLIGAAIGMEREINEKKSSYKRQPAALHGVRTFSLAAILGGIAGMLFPSYPPVSLFICIFFGILLVIAYALDVWITRDAGITTEIGLLFCFLIGLMLLLQAVPVQIVLAIAVLLMLLLAQKDFVKNTVRTIRVEELNALISFLLIAMVVLPFLPNNSYRLLDIPAVGSYVRSFGIPENILKLELFNPFKLWMYVALITGIDLLGYVFERTIGGKKGWVFASIAGGFVSSTATTQSLAQESKRKKSSGTLIAAAIIANVVSFIQIGILIIPLNVTFFIQLFPILLSMIITGLLLFFYFIRRDTGTSGKHLEKQDKKHSNIKNLRSALTFVGLYVGISTLSKIALSLFGQGGFILTTALGSLFGIDAVVINTTQLVGSSISLSIAFFAFIMANAVNLAAKTFYSFLLGSKVFAFQFGLSMGIIIIVSIAFSFVIR